MRETLGGAEGRMAQLESTKMQKDLLNKPNASLAGKTFDASHLDHFLQTDYGEKGVYPVPAAAYEQNSAGKFSPGMDSPQKLIQAQSNVR